VCDGCKVELQGKFLTDCVIEGMEKLNRIGFTVQFTVVLDVFLFHCFTLFCVMVICFVASEQRCNFKSVCVCVLVCV
jgi:hypothetical protein